MVKQQQSGLFYTTACAVCVLLQQANEPSELIYLSSDKRRLL